MRFAIAAILVCLDLVPSVCAQPGDARFVERLEPFIQKAMRDDKITGLAIGIVEGGKPVYVRGFGIMDAQNPTGR